MTSYVVVHFDFDSESIPNPFLVSTPVSESIIARKVYRDCVVSIFHRKAFIDLIELNMVDFDVILGMD